ncbi:GAF domain-containing protein [Actinophytocola sp.]|uniref:helix-turn-helix domain-containing protein n=1 Tax=Actinophytocola sp. TaxID=1872138 RepID=UPI003D6BA9D8
MDTGGDTAALADVMSRLEDELAEVLGPTDLTPMSTAVLRAQMALAQDRRHQVELQGLVRTAQQLLGTQDLDSLTRVIVEATRDLLSADVAHLNLLGTESGHDKVVRAIDGAMSEAFRQQQTPHGAGLTGLIVRTKSAYVTKDYLSDPNIRHDPQGDASVRADGLRTMAGVPLLRGSTVIGVLFVSYRKETTVASDQLSLLLSLAALASVAVDNARLNEERAEGIRRLRDANDATKRTNSLLEWSSAAHDQLTDLMLADADVNALAQTVRRLFSCPVLLLDTAGGALAAVDEERTGTEVRRELGDLSTFTAATATRSDGTVRWTAPAMAAGELLGLVSVRRDSLSEVEQRTLERCGMTLALLLAIKNTIEEADKRVAADIVDDLLSGGQRALSAVRRAAGLGLDVNSDCVVIMAKHGSSSGADLHRLGRSLTRQLGGLANIGPSQLAMIVPGEDVDGVTEQVRAALAADPAPAVTAGVAAAHGVSELTRAAAEADKCAHALRRLGFDNGAASAQSLGFVGLVLAGGKPGDVSAFVQRTLGPLLSYDSRRGAELTETVRLYLAESSSLKATAARMHIHTNTVLQRLRRASSILGEDWQSPDRTLEIRLALRLNQLMPSATTSSRS